MNFSKPIKAYLHIKTLASLTGNPAIFRVVVFQREDKTIYNNPNRAIIRDNVLFYPKLPNYAPSDLSCYCMTRLKNYAQNLIEKYLSPDILDEYRFMHNFSLNEYKEYRDPLISSPGDIKLVTNKLVYLRKEDDWKLVESYVPEERERNLINKFYSYSGESLLTRLYYYPR